jgi:hypothetical protein
VLDAIFTTSAGRTLRVPAFWAGGRTFKLRFSSPQPGEFTFRTECSNSTDTGLHGQTGVVRVTDYRGANTLYRHGPIVVGANGRFLEHADGTPFFWLGDTWWMGLTKRLDWPEGFQALATDRRSKGFTVIQLVGGLPPDMAPLDPRGAGEGGQAWTPGFERIRPEFYNAADRRIEHLVEQGLVPCIVGAWKQYLPVVGPEKMKRHWRNLIARYGAYPVVWIVGGEVNRTTADPRFTGGLSPVMEDAESAYERGWSDVARFIHRTDPFNRIVGAHNQQNPWVLDDPKLLDIRFLQTGHSALCSISAQVDWFERLSRAEHRAPLILSEANYQWLFHVGSFGDQLQRHQFWATMLHGGAGHTYGANGLWQVNQPDKPFGASPHGFVWGDTPWREAMQHAASTQLGWSKEFMSALPWQKLVPANERVRFLVSSSPPLAQSDARWIGLSEPCRRDAVIGTVFDIPTDASIQRATLYIASEAPFTLAINGQMVHRNAKLEYRERWKHEPRWMFPIAGEYLQPGGNTLLLDFDAEDLRAAGRLSAVLAVELSDGTSINVGSNSQWRWEYPTTGWPGHLLQLDPSTFATQMEVVDHLDAEATPVEFHPLPTYGPLCATVPDRMWIIYSPGAVPLEVSGLESDTEFKLTLFNPRTNQRALAGPIRSDAFGRWRWEPPRESGDWVLLIERGTPVDGPLESDASAT